MRSRRVHLTEALTVKAEAQSFGRTTSFRVAVYAFTTLQSFPSGDCCGGTAVAGARTAWVPYNFITNAPTTDPVEISIVYLADANSSNIRSGELSSFSSAGWSLNVSNGSYDTLTAA